MALVRTLKRYRILLIMISGLALFRWADHTMHRMGGRTFTSKLEIPASQPRVAADLSLPTELLDQKFFFLGKGSQAYAFLSQDGTHVLKFYKQHIYEPPSVLAHLPFGPWKAAYEAKKRKFLRTASSTQLAFKEFKEETGLLYVHLLPTAELKHKVKLFDKKGREQMVDLDTAAFVIQKRADLIYPHLAALMKEGKVEEAKQALTSLFSLLEKFGRRGVVENDPILRKNFGFIGGVAAQIDVGKMRIEPALTNTDTYKNDIPNITSSLNTWLETNYPELLPHFQQLRKI